jgi:CHAT domain-containing protein
VIFDPLENALRGCRRLFVAPDGAIARVPLEVLPDGATGHLIDSFIVSYLTCGRDAIRFGASPVSQASPPVVIGDPDFDLASSGEPPLKRRHRGPNRFERLIGAHEEAINVAEVLGVDPILGNDALEGRLKRIIRGPQILHFATHGFFLQDPPETKLTNALNIDPTIPARLVYYENPVLRSGIALAGANRWILGEAMPSEAEDGIMTGADVAELSLSGTDLVVLSACQTGLGVVQIGEGIIGLSSAFLAAGARTIVASLWQVKELGTGQLMVTFYEELRGGTPCVEALTRSRRALKEISPNPATWGPFVCIGDPGPLALLR